VPIRAISIAVHARPISTRERIVAYNGADDKNDGTLPNRRRTVGGQEIAEAYIPQFERRCIWGGAAVNYPDVAAIFW
jgi:hypothetical protein